MTEYIGIDVGGTGIKAAVVDTDNGKLQTDRLRIPTPRPSTPDGVADVIRQLVGQFDVPGTIGCCFPTVIVHGQARTASNMGEAWRGAQVDSLFGKATGHKFVVLNDADAAGLAEIELGAGQGLGGVVIMITVGTGIGSALIHDGKLVPNSELGHMPGKDGRPVEKYASNQARQRDELTWEAFGERLNYFLGRVERVLSPDHLILGGGVSKKFDLYKDSITISTPIRIARFRNNAGIIGAALSARMYDGAG